jgi:DNA-binding winged helix-turn-helix (wHTH) protein/tetratricopeptide (TPR) repeat protein
VPLHRRQSDGMLPCPFLADVLSMSAPSETQTVVYFGVFEADLRTGHLRKKGVGVKIQDLPFRTLKLLLSRPNEIVTREEFRKGLWPQDVFVDFDRGISSAIKRLRDALGDSADNPIFVETVDRHGYRWIAPIHPAQAVSGANAEDEKNLGGRPPFPGLPRRRTLVLALPVLAPVFVVWLCLASYRNLPVGAKSRAASASAPRRAPNREAEDYYLKGRFYWNKRTPEALNRAVDSFTQAIVRDPNYADAYVGLADCYNLLREYTLMPPGEAYPRALAAAKKAVELDDNSSGAHASLAFVSFYGMWDTATADEEFRRAIDLDPNNANAHHWYATYLQTVRRFDESLVEIDHAQKLDPNSASILADKGRLLWVAGRHEEALRLLQQLEEDDPNFVSPHRYLKLAYLDNAENAGYLSEMKREALLLHDERVSAIAEAAERGLAARGERGMLEGQLDQQKKAYAQGNLSPFDLAESYSRLGNTREALQYLETCYDRHVEEIVNIDVDSAFYNLRRIPAFQQLVAKVGLPSTN